MRKLSNFFLFFALFAFPCQSLMMRCRLETHAYVGDTLRRGVAQTVTDAQAVAQGGIEEKGGDGLLALDVGQGSALRTVVGIEEDDVGIVCPDVTDALHEARGGVGVEEDAVG